MHEYVAVAQMLEREHLSAAGRASTSEYVPRLTEWSIGTVFLFQVLLEQSGPGRCVACKPFQSYRIGFERKPFLLRGSVEKCATINAC